MINVNIATNGIENFWSHLKRMIDSNYHWVSKIHLQSYVNEEMLRFNTRHNSASQRFNYVLGNVNGRLKYSELIAVRDKDLNLFL